MGSGASRINSAPHPVTCTDTAELFPEEPTSSSPHNRKQSDGSVEPPEGRRRIFSDPLVVYKPPGQQNKSNNFLAPVTQRAKLIFSPLLSPPNESKPVKRLRMDSKKKSAPILQSEFSHRKAERKYWLDIDATFRKGSWNEIQISAILSKPLTGQVRKVVPVKKTKVKNTRTIAVGSHQSD